METHGASSGLELLYTFMRLSQSNGHPSREYAGQESNDHSYIRGQLGLLTTQIIKLP